MVLTTEKCLKPLIYIVCWAYSSKPRPPHSLPPPVGFTSAFRSDTYMISCIYIKSRNHKWKWVFCLFVFWGWLNLFSIIGSSCIHLPTNNITSVFIVYIDHILYSCLQVGHQGWSVVSHYRVEQSQDNQCAIISVMAWFESFRETPRSGSYAKPVVSFWRTLYTGFLSDRSSLHSYWWYRRAPFCPHAGQCLLFVSLMSVIQAGVRWDAMNFNLKLSVSS